MQRPLLLKCDNVRTLPGSLVEGGLSPSLYDEYITLKDLYSRSKKTRIRLRHSTSHLF